VFRSREAVAARAIVDGSLNSVFAGEENPMNEEALNLSIRKFLKVVGINSQREIERAVDRAVADGALAGRESFPASMTLEIAGLQLSVKFEGEIKLQ
jgi:hypothetical protein